MHTSLHQRPVQDACCNLEAGAPGVSGNPATQQPEHRAVQTHALQRAVSKYGIVELARTGKICLKRGEELLEMGGWGEGQAPPGTGHTPGGSAGSAAEPRAEPERQQAQQQAGPRRAEGNDVYVDSDDGQAGVQQRPQSLRCTGLRLSWLGWAGHAASCAGVRSRAHLPECSCQSLGATWPARCGWTVN